ncbi:MAG: UbiA family prenyltransferase, partial [Deinococcus sp.]|nr:UbiA family prenyltransferase [Deinococcus sp.]
MVQPLSRPAPVLQLVARYLDLIKVEHTLFALPFAYVGMLLAGERWPGWRVFLWVTLAMVGARTAAMAINRLVDRHIDGLNPRTARRHLVQGTLSPWGVWQLALLALVLLALAASQLNALALRLLPFAVLALVIYPYTKRFTWLCHGFLGVSVGAAAAGGWIATSGTLELATWTLWAAVALWISGFDVLYALLDLDFDRRQGLYSLPARFGTAAALWAARSAHGATLLLLLGTGLLTSRGGIYYLGLAALALV